MSANTDHIAVSPAALRTESPSNGVSAKPIEEVLPKAPMYAPRRSGGDRPATIACEVGTHSISPITKTKINAATNGMLELN